MPRQAYWFAVFTSAIMLGNRCILEIAIFCEFNGFSGGCLNIPWPQA